MRKIVSLFLILCFIQTATIAVDFDDSIDANIRKEYPNKKIVYGGGVLSNSIIKSRLLKKFDNIFFAEPQFSSDNAAGIALLCRKEHLGL